MSCCILCFIKDCLKGKDSFLHLDGVRNIHTNNYKATVKHTNSNKQKLINFPRVDSKEFRMFIKIATCKVIPLAHYNHNQMAWPEDQYKQ